MIKSLIAISIAVITIGLSLILSVNPVEADNICFDCKDTRVTYLVEVE